MADKFCSEALISAWGSFLISLSKFNLPYKYFYVNHASRILQSHDLSGEGIKLWITYILFWPHKDMKGLPRWVISPMPGPPPRQHKHERQYTPSTHSVIPTRWRWNDDDGQTIFGDHGGLKLLDICLTGEEKPWKKPHPENLSRPRIEPGPAVWQARMLPLAPQRWTEVLLRAVNLRHGTHGFTSLPKNVILKIFTLLKIHLPWPGSNPRTLESEASMTTPTPPGSTHLCR